MKPSVSVRKRTPTSTGLVSGNPGLPGTADASHAVHGQGPGGAEPTLTVMPAPGTSRFAQSSAARTRRFAGPLVAGVVQLNVQLAPPVAGDHVAPPSTLTSTPRTEPPPASADVPLTVSVVLVGTVAPSSGKPIVEVGAVTSAVA